jgi:hypothetical protein
VDWLLTHIKNDLVELQEHENYQMRILFLTTVQQLCGVLPEDILSGDFLNLVDQLTHDNVPNVKIF